jgi:hypothetical protein
MALANAIIHFLQNKRRTLSGTLSAIEHDFRPAAVAAQYWSIYHQVSGSAG